MGKHIYIHSVFLSHTITEKENQANHTEHTELPHTRTLCNLTPSGHSEFEC